MALTIYHILSLLLYLCQISLVLSGTVLRTGSTCTVQASANGSDDAPAILEAFQRCGVDGTIQLHDPLYHIETVSLTEEQLQGTIAHQFNIKD